jgi:C4-dicarboxylate-specific signal transduction histidine kinase
MSGAIAHEIAQPLNAIVTNANAGVRWLNCSPPDLDRAGKTFSDIAAAGHRASEVIHSVRTMFAKGDHPKVALDTNELLRETIALVHEDLEAAEIAVRLELEAQLPPVLGHRGQLQQVILNIVGNAADAMRPVTERARVLRLKSESHDADRVAVSVEDSGTGISAEDVDRIFDTFFTTKPNGMGMGLAICRSIVEAHGGSLSASAAASHGSVYRLVLPVNR